MRQNFGFFFSFYWLILMLSLWTLCCALNPKDFSYTILPQSLKVLSKPGFFEFLDVQAGFRKGRGTRNQIANIHWIIKKAREFQKNICFCFIDYAKAFDCVDHKKLWKILKEVGIPDCLTCLLRNLYADQEATVRTGHGITDWFQIGKGIHQGWYCHPAYLTSMQSTSWETLGWKKHML